MRQEFMEPGHRQEPVPAGLEVTWTLADETRVVMVSAEDAEAVSLTYSSETSTSTATKWKLLFPLTDDVVHAMARSPSSRIRYTLLSEHRDIEVRRGPSVRIQQLFACLANRRSEPVVESP